MKRQMILICSCLLLIAGWLSAFLIKAIPQQNDFYYLVPALLLGCGVGLLLKLLSAMRSAIVVALMAIVSILTLNQIYPKGKVSVSGFMQRMQTHANGQPIPVQTRLDDRRGAFVAERTLYSHADIEVQLFSLLPGGVRMLAFGPDAALYASIPELGAIYRLTDNNGDGYADQPQLFHVGMDRPHGLVWHGDQLFVAETASVVSLRDTDRDQQVDEVRVVLEDLPDDGGHWTRSLALGGDGYLYLSIGSRCNACEETDQRRAAVLRVDLQNGDASPFASGLRNSVGLAFTPDGEMLWASDNGRDMLGDELPPDEINHIVSGGDYGWPYCYGDRIPDPELGNSERCVDTRGSAVDLPAHSAPLGIGFGDSLKAPADYRGSLYVAFHGSWNRSDPTGYKLVRIPFAGGEPEPPAKEFLSGWLQDGAAWGRPVAPLAGPDGALYLSDDQANAIYRIRWRAQE